MPWRRVRDARAQRQIQRVLIAVYVRRSASDHYVAAGGLGRSMPVPPNITQTAGDNQHVENHHRYDCQWNQVLHTYLLSGFDNLVISRAQPYLSFALQKLLL